MHCGNRDDYKRDFTNLHACIHICIYVPCFMYVFMYSMLQIVTHINKEYGVDLDVDVSLPKIKGNFKGTHTPTFEARKARVIPMTEEESVEDMFRALEEKKAASASATATTKQESPPLSSSVTAEVSDKAAKVDPNQTVFSGYLEKQGRGVFASWQKR